MRELKLKIIGTSPLLMNNPAKMVKGGTATKNVIPASEVEAAAGTYWTRDRKSLAVPSTAVHACLIRGGNRFKIKKVSLGTLICSSLHVGPEMIPLGTTEYEIDVRTAVVQRQRIHRARARIEDWAFEAVIDFDEEWLPLDVVQQTLPEVVRTAGQLIGLLDFRPEKKGPFGKFRLAEMTLLAPGKAAAVPDPVIKGFNGK